MSKATYYGEVVFHEIPPICGLQGGWIAEVEGFQGIVGQTKAEALQKLQAAIDHSMERARDTLQAEMVGDEDF